MSKWGPRCIAGPFQGGGEGYALSSSPGAAACWPSSLPLWCQHRRRRRLARQHVGALWWLRRAQRCSGDGCSGGGASRREVPSMFGRCSSCRSEIPASSGATPEGAVAAVLRLRRWRHRRQRCIRGRGCARLRAVAASNNVMRSPSASSSAFRMRA